MVFVSETGCLHILSVLHAACRIKSIDLSGSSGLLARVPEMPSQVLQVDSFSCRSLSKFQQADAVR